MKENTIKEKEWFIGSQGYMQIDPKPPQGYIPPSIVSPSSGTTHPSIADVPFVEQLELGHNQTIGRVYALEQEVKELHPLKKDVAELKVMVRHFIASHSEVVDLKDIPYEKAKELIAQYFREHDGEELDAADLHQELGIEFETVLQAIEDLDHEGRIKPA